MGIEFRVAVYRKKDREARKEYLASLKPDDRENLAAALPSALTHEVEELLTEIEEFSSEEGPVTDEAREDTGEEEEAGEVGDTTPLASTTTPSEAPEEEYPNEPPMDFELAEDFLEEIVRKEPLVFQPEKVAGYQGKLRKFQIEAANACLENIEDQEEEE